MTYRGKRIGIPTLEMIQEYVKRKHKPVDPEWVYNHYKERQWKTTQGKVFRSLEIMVGTSVQYFCHGRTPTPIYITPYKEQLQDPRWKAFREFIFVVRNKQCELCGKTTHLQVHHPKYITGRRAWEYNCNEVQVLCRECHAKIHNVEA